MVVHIQDRRYKIHGIGVVRGKIKRFISNMCSKHHGERKRNENTASKANVFNRRALFRLKME